jgi:hypothetical protein
MQSVALRVVSAVALCALLVGTDVLAAGKSPSKAPSLGKKVFSLDHVDEVEIQMPDSSFYHFGQDYRSRLETLLIQSGKYVLHRDAWPRVESGRQAQRSQTGEPDYVWMGSTYPAARVKVKVMAMNFTTGWKGEQIFSGFDERNRSPYNDGFNRIPNEFPLKSNEESAASPNWFDGHFDGKGEFPRDSRAGLDLGDGFNINFLFVWLAVKYARYVSDLALRIEIDSELTGRHEYREVRVGGEGFFFDVSGAYLGYSVGIQVARKDAMYQAFRGAIDGSMAALDRALKDLPFTGRVDHILPPNRERPEAHILVGTGTNAAIPRGTLFEVQEVPGTRLESLFSNEYGTVMRVKTGQFEDILPGMLVRQFGSRGIETQALALRASGNERELAATENIKLPWKNFKQVDFKNGEIPSVSMIDALGKSIVGIFTLGYRIWRYSMYDRPYQARPDHGSEDNEEWSPPMDQPSRSGAPAASRGESVYLSSIDGLIRELSETAWAKKIDWRGETEKDLSKKRTPVIAIIDSGVDYNHPVLHGHLKVNADAPVDPRGRKARYGWDFLSGDSRPADDHFHGTELASLAMAIAPHARYLPIKVFSPYGITTSAALYSAFEFAVNEGADIILCGWATRRESKAIEDGVKYAQDHGVIVVAAAGDRGKSFERNRYLPATLAKTYGNVLPVFGVDAQDRLAASPEFSSNHSTTMEGIAAPSVNLRVANPRNGYDRASSTSHAAALVAGALARKVAQYPEGQALPAPEELIRDLLEDAEVVSGLSAKLKGGRRLRLR